MFETIIILAIIAVGIAVFIMRKKADVDSPKINITGGGKPRDTDTKEK